LSPNLTQPTAAGTEWLAPALRRMGLLGAAETPEVVPLAGGVSSDIYRVQAHAATFCVKRALPRLKVSAVWNAPVERNRWEVAWMREAAAIVPGFVPRVLGEDAESGSFAMEFLAPKDHPVWKAELRDGIIDPRVAQEVARRIAAVHAATAGDTEVARRFATDAIFHSIRLEPYLLATAERHPDCGDALRALVSTTAANKRALVHGDVSPKNILIGPGGPILLDAECAWYGDPAFDLAFCLNHMLLKCLWRPQWRERYLACFEALAQGYLAAVSWEPAADIERRTAHLLPGLFLGRVDGKSPVEYVTNERDKERVRSVARRFLLEPPAILGAVVDAWKAALAK
jgi:aminoglycoside phosphotransferase (APT) family kinase protein